jgi:hypothetical protein
MGARIIDPHLQAVFEQLNDDVTILSWKWQIVSRLFESEERVDIVNQTAPNFFLACKITFTDDVFLTLSRITDPLQSNRQDNLVISRLSERLDRSEHPKLHDELTRLIAAAIKACKPFKRHRHKRLAHNDLNIKLKYTTEPLPGIKVGDVNRAVKSLQDVVNAFNRYFFDRETHFTVVERGGVKALFVYLQKGVEGFESEKQQMLAAHGLTSGSSWPQQNTSRAKGRSGLQASANPLDGGTHIWHILSTCSHRKHTKPSPVLRAMFLVSAFATRGWQSACHAAMSLSAIWHGFPGGSGFSKLLKGRWRKLKGKTKVRLPDGTVCKAEVHWYEAHGIGRKELKIKRILSEWTMAARMKANNQRRSHSRFVVCIKNDGYSASLEKCKIYRVLTDRQASAHGLLRIVDESGEDYLYPVDFFVSIKLPQPARVVFSSATPT